MVPHDFGQIPFLRDADAEVIMDAARDAIWVCLPGGSVLFAAGEAADTLWFVRSGALGAFRATADGQSELIGYIRAGEPVGEMALVAGEAHSASVYAMRDTELFGIERASFNRLIRRHPQLMQSLARTILFRSRQARRSNLRENPKIVALIGTNASQNMGQYAQGLADSIATIGKKAKIVTATDHFNVSWLDDVERWHDVVLLVSDKYDSPWARQCLRQADRVWVFAQPEVAPPDYFLPPEASPAKSLKLVDVILCHQHLMTDQYGRNSFAAQWSASSGAARLFPWHTGHRPDVEALARTLVGQSVGLLLGGGGARAYAHIGAIRALSDAGIKFDFIGGTSMGGVVGACVAMGWPHEEIERRIWEAFVKSNPLDDYNLPVVAMAAGMKVDARLADNFGDVRIEDMQRPFFCVSTNLSKGRIFVHRTGILRHALRASIALPGILPPKVIENDVHVDGAVLDNLPIGTMREFHRGMNIAVDVTRQHALNTEEFRDPPNFFQWVMRHGFKSPPPIADLLMRAATAPAAQDHTRSDVDFLIVPDLQKVQLRDWKAFDIAVEAGYKATVEALKERPPQPGGLIAI